MNTDAIVQLNQFGFLAVTGRDAQKFLQGYTTCDLEQIPDDQAVLGAICNIKGRMLANFMVCRQPDGFLLRLDRELVMPTIDFLKKYIVFSKAQLLDLSDTLYCYAILSNKLTESADDYPQTPLGMSYDQKEIGETTTALLERVIKVGAYGWELWTPSARASSGSVNEWQESELSAGIVWVDKNTSEEYLPQMFNLHNIDAISFEKGCYLGQEIVARMQYRGELKKRLHLSTMPENFDTDDVPSCLATGAKILDQAGKNVGNIIASQKSLIAMVIKAGEPTYTLEDGTNIQPKELDL